MAQWLFFSSPLLSAILSSPLVSGCWWVLQHCMENYSSSSTDVWIFAGRHSAAPENLRVRPTIVFPSQEQIGAGADKFLQSHFDVGWSPIVLFPYFALNKSQMSSYWEFSFFLSPPFLPPFLCTPVGFGDWDMKQNLQTRLILDAGVF